MSQHYVVPNIYEDLSNQSQGYFAFRFVCQQCYWHIDTTPTRSTVSTVSNIADIGVGLLGGFWGRAAEAGQKIYGSKWHEEQAHALQKAWQEIQVHFHFCPKCQRTVCSRCFNIQLNLCLNDAPDLRADGAAFQHELNVESQRQQIQEHYQRPQFDVSAIPSAATPDMLKHPQPQYGQQSQPFPPSSPTPFPQTPSPSSSSPSNYPQMVMCPQCRRMGPPGKFCQDCGAKLPLPQVVCSQCSSPVTSSSRFCPECGNRLQ